MIRTLVLVTVAGVVYVAAAMWATVSEHRSAPAGVRWE